MDRCEKKMKIAHFKGWTGRTKKWKWPILSGGQGEQKKWKWRFVKGGLGEHDGYIKEHVHVLANIKICYHSIDMLD